MADYSALRDTINNNIVPNNGRQEITGAKLNSVLNSMVDVLGEGYTFLGVATISTTPTTPEGKAYYLAGAAGTYSNFGNIVVASDEVALLVWDGTAWSKVATGAASLEEVTEINTILRGQERNYTEGVYVNSDGSLVAKDTWCATEFIPIVTNEDIVWVCGSTPTSEFSAFLVFYDSAKNPIANSYFGSLTGTTSRTILASLIQTFAPNGVYVRASFKKAELTAASVTQGDMVWTPISGSGSMIEDVETLKEEMANVPNLISQAIVEIGNPLDDEMPVNKLFLDSLTENYYIDSYTGELSPYTGWFASDYIEVTPSTDYLYLLPNSQGQYGNGASCFWAAYDENKNFVNGDSTNATKQITTGANAKYLRVSFGGNQLLLKPMVVSAADFTSGMTYEAPADTTYREAIKQSSTAAGIAESLSEIKIVAPDDIALVANKPMDLLYDNITYGADANQFSYCNGNGSIAYSMRNRVRLLGTAEGATPFDVTLQPFGSLSHKTRRADYSLYKRIIAHVVPTTAGSGLTKRVMLIGDSITANGKYPREIRNLFANDPMSVKLIGTLGYGGVFNDGNGKVYNSNGDIVVDGFTFNANGEVVSNATGNVVRDYSGDNMTFYHEGRGGWSAHRYCTEASYNGYVNAFMNPSTNKFDFAYYMTKFGFDGVDYVFINLGINDLAEYNFMATDEDMSTIISYYNEMIASILAFSANIKIFIGLCIPPANYEFSDVTNLGEWGKTGELALHQKLINTYGGTHTIVPLNFPIDTRRDFPTEDKAISARDETLVPYCTDVIHPKNQAYYKIADVCYAFIKYQVTL